MRIRYKLPLKMDHNFDGLVRLESRIRLKFVEDNKEEEHLFLSVTIFALEIYVGLCLGICVEVISKYVCKKL